MDKKNYIGRSKHGEYFFQEIRDGVIRGFSGYDLRTCHDGERGLENCSWQHKVELEDGTILESGSLPAKVATMPDEIDGLYEINTVSCESCGDAHDTEQYGASSFVIVNECEVYCKGCVKSSDLLVEIEQASDFFKAKDISDIDLEGYEEIDTLFCDSSGMGHSGERALTKSQALERVKALMAEHGTMYAGITSMGQFQVYVTLYKQV